MVLAAPGFAATTDFDEGFTSYLSGNYTRAFILWLPLAEAGEIEAQFGLGLLYEQGRGVLRDIEAAASWYARAAEHGSMRAPTQLGGTYARGDGVPEVRAEHFHMARTMGQRWLVSTLKVVEDLGATTSMRDTEAILATIQRQSGITRSALMRKHKNLRKRDFDEFLNALEERDEIVIEQLSSSGGRPRTVIRPLEGAL